MTSREWLAALVLSVPLAGIAAVLLVPRGLLSRTGVAVAITTGGAALALATVALARPERIELGRWIVVDTAGGLLVGVIGVVGTASALVSPQFLAHRRGSLFRPERADRVYWATLLAFWAVLLAVPLAGNLGAAWLAIEATTAASALLVGFSGRARALEAGWKYLILTSLGLGVALLGILVLAAAAGGGGLETLTWRSLPRADLDPDVTLVAYVLLLAGLAAKIGWAPVHNWLRTPTPKHPPRYPRCSPPRSCPPCSSSPGARNRRSPPRSGTARPAPSSWRSGSSRSPWPSRSCGARRPGSGCSPTRASSTWA